MELLKNLEGLSADEQMTAVVELQKAAMKHLEEQKQASIGKSAELVIQGLKKIKSDFEAKFDSLNYDIQTKVASLKDGEQGLQGPKGDQGERGLDGANGRDGRDGKDGKDGVDGVDGVGVRDAKIDFDGSLVISLTDGREINCGEVVSVDVAKQIQKVTHNIQTGSGGDSQTVLDAIAALQATIATYGTMATQNANNVAITGGAINNTTIGATTPNTGVFTTLTATGQTSLGGAAGAEGLRVLTTASAVQRILVKGQTSGGSGSYIGSASTTDTDVNLIIGAQNAGAIRFSTARASDGTLGADQMRISNTASAVNYVQVTGAATGGTPQISAQGSDASANLAFSAKGASNINFFASSGSGRVFTVNGSSGASTANYLQAAGGLTTVSPVLSAQGSDTNIPLVLQPKGTGALQAQQADGTATGGNVRGANAVDWQTARVSASNVASGQASTISGGQANQASGFISTVSGGNGNAATGTYSAIGAGTNNVASRDYAYVGGGTTNSATGVFNVVVGGFTNTGTANAAVTTQSATMNGTTAVTLAASNASIKVGQYITGTSIAGDTYVAAVSGTSLTLSKNASGSSTSTLSFYTPHGVVVGGGNNQATGAYSFIGGGGDAGTAANRNVASGDWSVVGGGRNNTASGAGSFIGGGGVFAGSSFANTASGAASFVGGGLACIASNQGSVAVGGYNLLSNGAYSSILGGTNGTARAISGYTVFAASNTALNTVIGNNQAALLILARQTTDATATVLCSDQGAASTTNQVILPNNSAYYFRGEVVSGVTGGGNTKGWTIEGVIKRGANAASTTLVGSTVTSMYADVGAATWTIALSADTTNGGLAVTFTGQAATTIRTVAQIRTTEMTY